MQSQAEMPTSSHDSKGCHLSLFFCHFFRLCLFFSFLPPQPKDRELTMPVPLATSYLTYSGLGRARLQNRPVCISTSMGLPVSLFEWEIQTATFWYGELLPCRCRMYTLTGRWLWSLRYVQLFGLDTGGVRQHDSLLLTSLVLWCWIIVSGSLLSLHMAKARLWPWRHEPGW